ncbi:MAG: hypothetical protein IT163_04855 [Bryobacterales bacterium]|nr:hypothetical protein [Bryobacterales bacterium]
MRSVRVIAAAVGVVFATVLTLGFLLRGRFASVSDQAFGTAAGLAIPALACLFAWAFSGFPLPGRRARLYHTKEGSFVLSPEFTSGQAAYERDRTRTATCAHLRPVERAMRAAGIVTRLEAPSRHGPAITAECRIHEDELRRMFALDGQVRYCERYESRCDPEDTPLADLVCGRCVGARSIRGGISVRHPGGYFRGAPWFPRTPAGASEAQ